jgi:hypothetical protein
MPSPMCGRSPNYWPTTGGRLRPTRSRGLRATLNLLALAGGGIVGILFLPMSAPWLAWIGPAQKIPGPFVVGLVAAGLVVLLARPLSWK